MIWNMFGSSLSRRLSKTLVTIRRKMSRLHSTEEMPLELQIGGVDPADHLASSLHSAAVSGNKRSLRSILNKGISVDYANDLGQSPLFCAVAASNATCVSILLQNGADPNHRDNYGVTPLLVACYIGNIGLLCKIIEKGGDMCIVDNNGDGIIEWAEKNKTDEVRNYMKAFLQQTHFYGLMHTAQDKGTLCDYSIPYSTNRAIEDTSIMELVKKSTGSDISLQSHESTGYGRVYPCANESAGIVSVVSLISEMMLMSVENVSYECSLDFTMREMEWLTTEVSVKMLKSEFEIKERAKLILKEASLLSKMRHPNVILLMALCQPNTLDMLTLVFERVHNKNLYQYLHVNTKELKDPDRLSLGIQLCSAIGFIHNQGYIHCGLSSMAVYLSFNLTVKLGNFEFMVERSEAERGLLSSVNYQINEQQLYYWMAPEIIDRSSACDNSDIYSFSCILWEIYSSIVPWSWLSYKQLSERFIQDNKPEMLPAKDIPQELNNIICTGLRKKGMVKDIDQIYNSLKELKENRNSSHNSLPRESSPWRGSHRSASEKSCPQDNLLFGSESFRTRGRISNSTSAFPFGEEYKGNGMTRRDLKATAVQDWLDLRTEPLSRPAIKPASHQQQPDHVFKTNFGLGGPNIGLGEKRSTNISNASSQSREDDDSIEENPKCVRTLAEGYQEIIVQHKLRQDILKGSMAPQGCCNVESPLNLNSTRYNSLPSTIKELSKTWSPQEESIKTTLSDMGNLSCTPVTKKTSTPLRKSALLNLHGAALVDFFKPKQTMRDVGTICRMDETNLENTDSKLDFAIALKANMIEEMKKAQKKFDKDLENESSPGVCYHSPIIEVRRERASSVEYLNFLPKVCETDDSISSENVNTTFTKVSINEENNQIYHVDVYDHDEDDSLKDFHLHTFENSETNKDLTLSSESGEESVISERDQNDQVVESRVENMECKQTKDSFWDLTHSSWHRNQTEIDDFRPNSSAVCDGEDEGTVMGCAEDVGFSEQVQSSLCVSESLLAANRNQMPENVEVKKKTENRNEQDADNATFNVPVSKCEDGGLDTTFTLEADGTQPDSWFLDSVMSNEVSHWVSDQLNIIKHEILSTGYADGDDVRTTSSIQENLPGIARSDHLIKSDSNSQEIKSFEFEFKEFYIDDDLDNCEKIQPLFCSESQEMLDCNACTRAAPGELSEPQPPPLTLHINRFALESSNNVLDCKLQNSTSANTVTVSGSEKEAKNPTDTDMDLVESDSKDSATVKEKILLFGGNMGGSYLASQEYRNIKNQRSLQSNGAQHISKLDHMIKLQSSSTETVTKQSCCSNQVQKETAVVGENKIRLIPKKKVEDSMHDVSEVITSDTTRESESEKFENKMNRKTDARDSMRKPLLSEGLHHQVEALQTKQNQSQNLGKGSYCCGTCDGDIMYHDDDNVNNMEDEEQIEMEKEVPLKDYQSFYNTQNPIVMRFDVNDCESDDWIKDRLRVVQERIRRRRQHLVSSVSSDDDEDTKDLHTFQGVEGHHQYLPSEYGSTVGDDFLFLENITEKTDSFHSQQRQDSHKRSSCSSLHKVYSFEQAQDDENRREQDMNSVSSRTHRSLEYFQSDEMDEMKTSSLRKSASRALSGSKFPSYTKVASATSLRSVGTARRNESKSSLRTVMFEDETDGLKELSPRASCLSQGLTVPVPKPRTILAKTDISYLQDMKDDFSWGKSSEQAEEIRNLSSVNAFDSTFDVVNQDFPDQTTLPMIDKFDKEVKRQLNGDRHCSNTDGERCVTLALDHNDKVRPFSREKMATLGDNVYTEVHRFYIPKENWPDGCKTRLHMDLCPNNPCLHRIKTTAIDPVSGHQEVLMEKTVESNRLKSHLSLN